MKLALYSVTYSGLWYDGRPLTMEEVIDKAAKVGYSGIEIDGKRPHGFPLDWSAERRKQIRALADATGVEIACIAANNDFTKAVPEELESQILTVTMLIELAADMGVPMVRLFAAWPGVTLANGLGSYDLTRVESYRLPSTQLERWHRCRASLEEVTSTAAKHGVQLTLQNHKPLIDEPQDLIDMVRSIDSPHLRCTMDCHLLDQQTDEYVQDAVRAAADFHVFSHFAGEYERSASGSVEQKKLPGRRPINYAAYIRALRDIGFDGYLSYELCHPVVDSHRRLQPLSTVDQQVELAFEYMSNILQDTLPQPSA